MAAKLLVACLAITDVALLSEGGEGRSSGEYALQHCK